MHGFPTFRYHLIDRAGDTYEWTFIADYLGGQLLVLGPFTSVLLLWAAWRYNAKNIVERILKWSLWGVLGFFLFQSFSQRTEANWTAAAVIPLIYLSYHYIKDRPVWRKWSFRLAIPSLVFFLILRLYLMVDFLPQGMNPRNEFHGWDQWAWDIQKVAGDRPVVFYNTYRGPSKYAFYTHQQAFSINKDSYAGNQYDLLPDNEEALQGKEVLVVNNRLEDGIPFSPGGLQTQRYMIVDDFRSFNRVQTRVIDAPKELPADTTIQVMLEIGNPTDQAIRFEAGARQVSLCFLVFYKDEITLTGLAVPELTVKELAAKERQVWAVTLKTPEAPGKYRYRFGFEVAGLFVGRNGNFNKLEVEPSY
ncbi:MAG: hypothetical protein IPJ40_17865 [Saprospirales bacterium]|nr:hypothetical protein [Saprospirales bacterium]